MKATISCLLPLHLLVILNSFAKPVTTKKLGLFAFFFFSHIHVTLFASDISYTPLIYICKQAEYYLKQRWTRGATTTKCLWLFFISVWVKVLQKIAF